MKNLIEEVNKLYIFSRPIRFLKKIQKGYLTSNFVIGNGKEKYFLKEYRDNVLRVKNTHVAKEFLAKKGIPVILPLKNKRGKTFFVRDKKVYGIFPYVIGKQFQRLKVPRKNLEAAGELLAKIHLLSKDGVDIGIRKRRFVVNRKISMEKARNVLKIIKEKKHKTEFDKMVLEHLASRAECIRNNLIRVNARKLGKNHIIHADYHESNMFFTGNKISYLFDWEMVSSAPRVMEIARFLDFFCFYGNYEKRNFLMAKNYLKAYHKIYPIEEEELLNGLIVWFYHKLHIMWSLEEYYIYNKKKSKKFIEQEMKSFQYYSESLEKFKKEILYITNTLQRTVRYGPLWRGAINKETK